MSRPIDSLSGNIVDVQAGRIFPGTLVIKSGRIAAVRPETRGYQTFIIPGFVDAHVHIESSMLIPTEFARLAVLHGTVATVSDPHEIGNVLGIEGVRFMLDNAARSPLKFCFGAPSCVPATTFETAGDAIDAAAVEALLADPRIGYLSEMMNFPGVIHGDKEVHAKLAAAKRIGKPIDGHAPGLRGPGCKTYFSAGITTDHECFTLDEALEKLTHNVRILIREGSAAKNFQALIPLLAEHSDRCMFCTDDKHPDELAVGHINDLAARAVAAGHDPIKVLRVASLNAVKHYGLNVGLLREGDPADAVEVEDLTRFRVRRTVIDGRLVAESGRTLLDSVPTTPVNRFSTSRKSPADFAVARSGPRIAVIQAADGQLITERCVADAQGNDGVVVPDVAHDILKLAVVNRYRNAKPAVAFIRNFALKHGAIASSVAHDSHNIIAVGTNDADLCRAVNLVIDARGGLSAVGPGVDLVLPLPVAGLMSHEDGFTMSRRYSELDRAAKQLGSTLRSPYMTLSFMALLVIPKLKLSDRGLFDGEAFRFTELFSAT